MPKFNPMADLKNNKLFQERGAQVQKEDALQRLQSDLKLKLDLLSVLETGFQSMCKVDTVMTQDALQCLLENHSKALNGAIRLCNGQSGASPTLLAELEQHRQIAEKLFNVLSEKKDPVCSELDRVTGIIQAGLSNLDQWNQKISTLNIIDKSAFFFSIMQLKMLKTQLNTASKTFAEGKLSINQLQTTCLKNIQSCMSKLDGSGHLVTGALDRSRTFKPEQIDLLGSRTKRYNEVLTLISSVKTPQRASTVIEPIQEATPTPVLTAEPESRSALMNALKSRLAENKDGNEVVQPPKTSL